MSGVSGPFAPGPDEVSIQIKSTRLRGWQTVSITRSCETMPNSWSVSASTEFFQGPALALTQPGQACDILIGPDVVITGWIDRRNITADARSHQVVLSGRGITRNLVDCSAKLSGSGTYPSTLNLATILCEPFGIVARMATPALSLGRSVNGLIANLQETPYQIIESAARYAGFLVYEDEFGALVLDQLGTNQHASGFAMPGNIERISGEQSVDGRFSEYTVVWTTIPQLSDLGPLLNNIKTVYDPQILEYRPKIIVAEQTQDAEALATARANWEMARRMGRSQATEITADSWRDKNNKLWTPNWRATVEAPDADITHANWIIGTVTFRKDMSGTHADLTLMPPNAFLPEPSSLYLYDAILGRSPQAQSPAPPSTDPPATPGVH
jgi:prophage tail gpP-like protein